MTVLATIFYVVVFVDPSILPIDLNEEKEPPVLVQLIPTPTPRPTIAVTDTPSPVPPTWTPKPTRTPYPTNTPITPLPTQTSRPTVYFTRPPTRTPTPSPTIHPWPFQLSEDGVRYMSYPFSSECNWLGIAGEVHDQEGGPVNGISVVLNGGGLQNIVTTSGSRPDYAESGWEHFLDSTLKEGDFTIQLWHNGGPVSEPVPVRTRADCRANLSYLVFRIVWEDWSP